MVRVKICGIRSREEATWAVEAGADALGFVFHLSSRRHIDEESVRRITSALPPFVARVGVFVNSPRQGIERAIRRCGLTAVQLHGQERAEAFRGAGFPIIKALQVPGKAGAGPAAGRELEEWQGVAQAILLDSTHLGQFGGTGTAWSWQEAGERLGQITEAGFPLILAGGLTPENVRRGIEETRPYAVDVSSGVEKEGVKDRDLIRKFMRRVREDG
ncbi:N-(5'-phosphoribosyl)anthranilate isomerase [Peptococcaceae bacterium CEB3]|nr:N-(5'-phosphoribosyl)anthranilate isomerase [Peptococcaceae bacterium CEB3]